MTGHAVVIAGGGPTGLMLAGELALARVDVAIVERLHPQNVRARGQPRDGKLPRAIQREVADKRAGRKMQRHDVRAKHALAIQENTARRAAGFAVESVVGIDVRDPRDVVGAERSIRDAAGWKCNRKHHRFGGDHPPPIGRELRFTQR